VHFALWLRVHDASPWQGTANALLDAIVHLPLWVPLIASPSSLVNGTNETRPP
jgi:hypothetical protein